MSLFDSLNKVIDVTAHGVRPGGPGEALVNCTETLNAIINGGGDDGLRVNPGGFQPPYVAPQHRGTLYFPPGRYLLEPDPDVIANWFVNFADQIDDRGQLRQTIQDAQQARIARPFGESLKFPEGTTLWLAPGAVLVPRHGCVVDISSLLICEDVECFDLSLGGLVVFGRAVPVLRPEWWKSSESVNASVCIQRAINAAVHDRSISYPTADPVYASIYGVSIITHWVRGRKNIQRPPLIVELHGEYVVEQTIEVRGDVLLNGIWRQRRPPGSTSETLPSGATTLPPFVGTILRGAWAGGRRRGASLIGHGRLEAPVLRLTYTQGLTVQDLTFVSQRTDYQPGVELHALADGAPGVAPTTQGIAFYRCRFEGAASPLVQVGSHAAIMPANPPIINTPTVRPGSNFGADLSLLSFEDCEFSVSVGGVGLDVRANQTLPIRYRRCDFMGDARALMSLWNSTHYLEGCRFANLRSPVSAAALPRDSSGHGLEEPDGSDIFLRAEYPWLLSESEAQPLPATAFPRDATLRLAGQVLIRTEQDLVPGLVALGCVSSSPQFLSTVSPAPGSGMQAAECPVLLINTRHRMVGRVVFPSVRWGLTNRISSASRGDPSRRDMSRGGPLVIIGGHYSRSLLMYRGACQSAVIGFRAGNFPQMDSDGYPDGVWPSTTVFGLRADQARPGGGV